ncbi:MAG: FAD-dependent monooxygenase [Elusimicrobia bacterium]|nr:FAD-dependent monooxygenase [Elusimicrobiota bacterium]
MATEEVPVIIVGGGAVGLTCSVLLSSFDVPSLLVERHPGTSIHPKARSLNARTMEIFRQCGIEQEVRAAGLPPEFRFLVWAESLAGKEVERRQPLRSRKEALDLSPVRNCFCPQDLLEPLLRKRAESFGVGELKFSTQMTSFRQDEEGVVATLLEDGRERQVRARYLIAADGSQSSIRDSLGIAMKGRANFLQSVNIHFRADLTRWIVDRPASLYFIERPDLKGTFLTINGTDRWCFLLYLPLTASTQEYTPEKCADVVRSAVGAPDLDVKVLGILPWKASAHVAERYSGGRVFLAGDAAHVMPHSGAMGMNTGIQDAINLSWKIAGAVRGWAGDSLMESYEKERQPHGRAATEQSYINALSRGFDNTSVATARKEFLNEMNLIFGATYESSAVLPDGTEKSVGVNEVMDYIPSARPGCRAPHVWLLRGDQDVSTIDLFGAHFTLLAGSQGTQWLEAGRALANEFGLPMKTHAIGPGGELIDPEKKWESTYGVAADGAILVRPDGHVGWRSRSAVSDARAELKRVLSGILGRQGRPARSGS